MKTFYSLIICILACCDFSAQGLILDESSYQLTEEWEAEEAFGFTTSAMPSRISYRRYTPAVANQGPLGTCVGWAIGYGQVAFHGELHNLFMLFWMISSAPTTFLLSL